MATNPTLLTMPIAENGQKNTIPATQAAAGDGLLSQSTGFPPETALPLGAGGKAPTREDFNGALNLLSSLAFFSQKGWTFQYDENQAYYKGCIVMDATDGLRYECINDVDAGEIVPSEDTQNEYWREYSPGGVPLGTILPYSGTGDTPPYGFLFFEGQAVSRTMYADYFDLVGTTYGEGDGENTFNLPNLIDAAMLNGSYTKTSYTTAGSATFTAPKTGWYKITVKGGGSGGQGSHATSGYYVGGMGGSEGGTTIGYEKMTAGDTASVVIGAGGTGGVGDYGLPGDGGDSAVTIHSTTYTGGGGKWAVGGVGDIPGAVGGLGRAITLQAAIAESGPGGGTGGAIFGRTGKNGGGGAGGVTRNGTISNGAAGGDGYVWIEYIGISMKYIGKVYDAPTPSSAQIDLSQYASDLAARLTREQTPAFNKRDVVTVSGTYTAPVTGWYRITVKGGGGGGAAGGVTTTGLPATHSGGIGGGEGGTSIGYEKMTAGQTASVVIGAGGAGGSTNGANGASGGNSTVTVNSNTYTSDGGGTGTGGAGSYCYGASGVIGGKGYIPTGVTTVPSFLGGAGGGNGGAPRRGTAHDGGGGYGGDAQGVNSFTAGGAGANGFCSFEYFDPTLM